MDILIAIWAITGLCFAIGISIFDDEPFSVFNLIVGMLFGPLILLWALFTSFDNKSESTPKRASKDKPKQPPKNTAQSTNSKKDKIRSVIPDELLKEFDDVSQYFNIDPPDSSKQKHQQLSNICTKIVNGKFDIPLKKREEINDVLQIALSNIILAYKDQPTGYRRRRVYDETMALLGYAQQKKKQSLPPKTQSAQSTQSMIEGWDLEFDALWLCSILPDWKINENFPEDKIILSTENSSIKLSILRYDQYTTFEDYVNEINRYDSQALASKNGINSQSFQYYITEVKEDGAYFGVFHCRGPGYRYVYLTWESPISSYDLMSKVVDNFKWKIPNHAYQINTIRQLRQVTRKVFKHDSIKEEILDGISETDVYIEMVCIEELLYQDDKYLAYIEKVIAFLLANKSLANDSKEMLFESLALFSVYGIDNKKLANEVERYCKEIASSYDDYMNLVNHVNSSKDKRNFLKKAINSVEHCYDLEKIIENHVLTQAEWAMIDSIVDLNANSEEFHSIGNPIDVMLLGLKKKFINADDFILRIKNIIQNASLGYTNLLKALIYIRSDEEIDFTKAQKAALTRLQNKLLTIAENHATSSDDLIEIYQILTDSLKDKVAAEKFKARHHEAIQENELSEIRAEKQDESVHNINKCVALVSLADGSFSEEEQDESEKITSYIRMFLQNEEAVMVLETTNDIDKARSVALGNMLIHHLSFGTPAFIDEVVDDIQSLSDGDNIKSLVEQYASELNTEYEKRIALWAAEEVAGVDGIGDSEKYVLGFFETEFEFTRKNNKKYFNTYIYPVIDEESDFNAPDDDNEDYDLFSAAKELDSEFQDNDDEETSLLLEQLGVDSFEALASFLLKDEDDEPVVEDTDAPIIFEVYLDTHDWEEVIAVAESGEDVNATMNFQGLAGVSIMHLCAEQGTLENLQTLIDLGGNVNVRLENVSFSSGYQDPVTAAIKGDKNDNYFLLAKHGAQLQPYDDRESGWTPLTMAASHANEVIIKHLIENNVDVNIANYGGDNALKCLSFIDSKSAIDCTKLLLDAGCDPLRVDKEGYGAIHTAISHGSSEVVKLLITSGACPIDFPIKGVHGRDFHTPLLRALAYGRNDIIQFLLDNSASLESSQKDKNIFTAIMYGTARKRLSAPNKWIDLCFKQDIFPTIEDISECIKDIASLAQSDISAKTIKVLSKLLNNVQDISALNDELIEEINESLEEGYENCENTINDIEMLLSEKGIKL